MGNQSVALACGGNKFGGYKCGCKINATAAHLRAHVPPSERRCFSGECRRKIFKMKKSDYLKAARAFEF